jgi:hypothetical protein
MPAVSKAQARLMQAVAHNPQVAKSTGIPQSVGQDYSQATTTTKGLPEHKRKAMVAALRKK